MVHTVIVHMYGAKLQYSMHLHVKYVSHVYTYIYII
jgi:hypothetical protein